MAEARVQRRLAAILAADVVGYSRLMGADEEGTLAALTAHRAEMIDPCISEHRGRVFKTIGDGLLAEFSSVVDAVRCAVAVQDGMRMRNADRPEAGRIEFRIGVNLGDVIVQDNDIFGDGVNVAARLEGLAEPGSVYVSGGVYEQIVNKIEVSFDDLGPQRVKNIGEPVRTFRVRPVAAGRSGSEQDGAPSPLATPSIAVLPFENMSADPEQEYFSDGITEDIITELSKVSGLFVIARHSAFTYKGKSVTVKQVGRELGVLYVLEGSVRKAGKRVRITAQLIDATSEHHLWAERYDRDLADIFAVQDEIVREIVPALADRLSFEGRSRTGLSATDSVEAYDLFLRGREHFIRQTREANERAKPLLERAIELSPRFAPAYAMLSAPLIREYVNGWVAEPLKSLSRANELAQRAVLLDERLPDAHWLLGLSLMWMKELDRAAREVERAIELKPSFADAYAALGQINTYAGRPDVAVDQLFTAMRLDPHYRDVFLYFLGQAYFFGGRYDEAIDALKRRLVRRPDTDITHVLLAASYGQLGRAGDAQAHWSEVFRINPSYSLQRRRDVLPFKNAGDFEKIIQALQSAGISV